MKKKTYFPFQPEPLFRLQIKPSSFGDENVAAIAHFRPQSHPV